MKRGWTVEYGVCVVYQVTKMPPPSTLSMVITCSFGTELGPVSDTKI